MGVKPVTVSNWIARGKLTAPALREDGRIDVALARKQIEGRVNQVAVAALNRRHAMERPKGKPGWPRGRPRKEPRKAPAPPDPREQANDRLLEARALSAHVDAERKRRDFEAERGRYTLTAEAQAAWARVLAIFLQEAEQSLADLALSLGLDRQQLVTLRRWWRNQRAKAAEANRAAGAGVPEFVEDSAA